MAVGGGSHARAPHYRGQSGALWKLLEQITQSLCSAACDNLQQIGTVLHLLARSMAPSPGGAGARMLHHVNLQEALHKLSETGTQS